MAIVAAYNFNALLPDFRVPDKSGYERHLTLSPGTSIAPGGGLKCETGGASKSYAADDYMANGASASCFAKVTTLSNAVGRRAITTISRGTSGVVRFLLSNASGNVEVEYGNHLSLQHFVTTTSIRDGAEHVVGFAIDVLSGTPTWRIWVDGTVVASGTPTADLPNGAGVFGVGMPDPLSNPPAVADALVRDVRWFNDPVYPAEAYLFSAPVTNLVVAAYNFNAGAGTLVADQTLRHNDLTLGANGQWVPGVELTGIGPIAAGNPAAAGVGLALYDGTFDRLSVLGWVRAKGIGASAAPFLNITDAAGNPKFQVFKGSAGGVLFKAFGDGSTWPFLDGNYRYGADGVLSTSEFRFLHINLNPTGFQIQVWGPTGTVIDDFQNYTFGTPPTNLPILTGLANLYVGGAPGSGGEVEWDDFRIVRNYLNPLALTQLRTSHVTQEPQPVIPGGATGAYSFGPAVADGRIEAEGGAVGAMQWGPAAADGESPRAGGFVGAIGWGPAAADGRIEAEGGFAGSYSLGPAVADGEAEHRGGATGSIAWGPATATGGSAPLPEGDFAGAYRLGPARADGASTRGGGFGGALRWGPAEAHGAGGPEVCWPSSTDVAATRPRYAVTATRRQYAVRAERRC